VATSGTEEVVDSRWAVAVMTERARPGWGLNPGWVPPYPGLPIGVGSQEWLTGHGPHWASGQCTGPGSEGEWESRPAGLASGPGWV
jgi:hypothetical protein